MIVLHLFFYESVDAKFCKDNYGKKIGNVLGANQSLHANYGSFNLDYQINTQGAWGIG